MLYDGNSTDVIIIGAGISGLAAAKVLKKHNVQHIILDASHRKGGRAYSEQLSSGNWFDLGCSYLHNGKINPFVDIASTLNFPLNIEAGNLFYPDQTRYFSNGKKLDFSISNPLDKSHSDLLRKISDKKSDDAIVDFMNIDDPYFPISCHLSSSLNAADVDLVSAKDYLSSYYDGPDYPVPGGFGNLVEAWSSDIKVMLNTKVSRIKWGGPFVELKTSQGTLLAKKIIITVSTGVLANNDIEMVPQLPAEKQNAISNLPMGTLNKIGISFKKQLFSEQERGWYITWPGKEYVTDQEVGSFEVSSSGLQNVVVFSGGRFGEWLEERGPKVMQDYAISKIESVLGSQCSKNIESVITTAWASEPFTKGAYSYATPNNSLAREELAKNIEKKLFFAGEATIPKHFGTAHGAYFSGINASKEIITCS